MCDEVVLRVLLFLTLCPYEQITSSAVYTHTRMLISVAMQKNICVYAGII